MVRSFDHSDLVMLPRMTAVSALGLLRATLSAAEAAGRLPAPIEEARADLQIEYAALSEAVRGREVAAAAESPELRPLDTKLDACWSAFYSWTSGWARLPSTHPEAAKAAGIVELIFPEGLKFTQAAYSIEWAESESRLELIKKQKLETIVNELGGRTFLAAIRDAHESYGTALGITAASAAAQEQNTVRVRAALDGSSAALRTFVVRVSAHVRKNDPKSEQLARVLLAPVTSWASTRNSPRDTTQPSPVNDPENQ